MSNPASLALPDSPELPAEIEEAIVKVFHAISRTYAARNVLTIGDAVEAEDAAVKSLRSVIAKHLLTAEEADHLLGQSVHFGKHIHAKLRHLSGSSRGEE